MISVVLRLMKTSAIITGNKPRHVHLCITLAYEERLPTPLYSCPTGSSILKFASKKRIRSQGDPCGI